jgi:hypothetical protein
MILKGKLLFLIILARCKTCSNTCHGDPILNFYSDENTFVKGPAQTIPGPSSLTTYSEPAMPAVSLPAKWISDEPITRHFSANEQVRYFIKIIHLPCPPKSAILDNLVDDFYDIYINGKIILGCFSEKGVRVLGC